MTSVCVPRDGLVLVSQEGEAWTASWPLAATPTQAGRRAVSPPTTTPKGAATVSLKLKRISHAHRAVAAACDPKGNILNSSSYKAVSHQIWFFLYAVHR